MKIENIGKKILTAAVLMGLFSSGYDRYKKSKTCLNCFHFINKLKRVPDNLHIINIGTTNAYYAFDYSTIEIPAMNMATYTQTLEYDLKILKKFAGRIRKNATVLITFEYPIFLVPHIPIERKEVFNQFAAILSRKEMPEWNVVQRIIYQALPCFLYKYNKNIKYLEELERRNGRRNHDTKRQRRILAEQKIKGWCKAAGITDAFITNGIVTKEMKQHIRESSEYLEQIVKLCNHNQWKPVFVVVPYSEEINSRLDNQFLDNVFYKYIGEIAGNKIPILDYSHDPKLSSGSCYMDEEYLNVNGRKIFTAAVIEELRNLGFMDEYWR